MKRALLVSGIVVKAQNKDIPILKRWKFKIVYLSKVEMLTIKRAPNSKT